VLKIALLGAESTGKSQLSRDLATALQARGYSAILVDEYLRSWCAQTGRTPLAHEQVAIAQVQTARITHVAQAQPHHTHLIADTTALLTAVYSDLLFGDSTLYATALEAQRPFDLTLLMGLDLPWVADGLQRDGPQSRPPVDARLRTVLAQGQVPFQVVYGNGPARLRNALNAIDSIACSAGRTGAGARFSPQTAWAWNCEKCSDPACEHRLFTDLLHR
jgi:nicotinamide riboside kinase